MKQKNHYLNNKDLLEEIIKSKKRLAENPELMAEAMTPKLANMIVLLVERFGMRPNWAGYSFLEEMKADARANLCAKWHKFDETKYDNPFSYFTQIAYTSFLGYMGKEKKVQAIRDNLLEMMGMNPSMTRQIENDRSWQDLGSDSSEPREQETSRDDNDSDWDVNTQI